jgi:hypothetical protein
MNERIDINICFNGELVTSYIYGEMTAPAITEFEDHLLNCDQCQTSFADLSEARLSVFEWNKLEFEPLVTPEISIAYKRKSRIREIWESIVVPHRWSAAAASFATIAVVLGAGFFLISGPENSGEIAASNQSEIQAASITKTERSKPLGVPMAPIEQSAANGGSNERTTSEIINISTKESHPQPAKQNITGKRSPSKVINTLPQTSVGENRSMRLNNFEELEDNSPRLSDLFDVTEAS